VSVGRWSSEGAIVAAVVPIFIPILAGAIVVAPRTARAADTTVPAGGALTLTDDIVLSGGDSFVAGAAGGARCTIDGAGHRLRAMDGWTGRISISSCDAANLGTDMLPGIDVSNAGPGVVFDVRDSSFATSGQIHVESFEEITFVFRGNTIAASSLVPTIKESKDNSRPSFHFRGTGGASQKLFQGNRVLHSWVTVEDGQNWLLGGSTPADGNIIIGTRAGIDVGGTGIVVRGNYVHPSGELAGWNQLAVLYANGTDGGLVVEHNVLRGGNWLVRTFAGGELRYNILADPYVVSWVDLEPDDNARVHHNLLLRNNKLMEQFAQVIGFHVINAAANPNLQIYNNTFDGSGYCYDILGRGVSINEGSFLQSLRSNVFFNLPSDNGNNTAIVGPGTDENFQVEKKGDPGPARLGYADYNLFDNPRAAQIDNYGASVAGLTERTSPGFALHDAMSGGAKDQQVDPLFKGPLPTVFPFSDDDVLAGTINVCQILAFYRDIYTPKDGSPIIGAGDPADGAGNNIGAIGAGTGDPAEDRKSVV